MKLEINFQFTSCRRSYPKSSSQHLVAQADLNSCEYLEEPFYIVNPETSDWYYFEPSGYKKV